jgi:hypothetical protein
MTGNSSNRRIACWTLMAALAVCITSIVPPAAYAQAPGKAKAVTFDDIKFEMKKGDPFKRSMLTDKIEQLEGQTIKISGWILPASVYQEKGIRQFVLVRDNQECCFGPGAALFDCVLVEMVNGKSANFSTRPVNVEGTFSVDEILGPDGKHLAIYRLDSYLVK